MPPKEAAKKIEELFIDPMGSIVATALLLDPHYKRVIKDIRDKYKLQEMPVEIEERFRYIHRRCRNNAQDKISVKKIYKAIYRQVDDAPKLKEAPDRMIKINEFLKLFTTEGLKKKRGRPKKEEWFPWPRSDIANSIYWWAVNRILLPLPEYFYNPNVTTKTEGVPITMALLLPMNENMISLKKRQDTIANRKSSKRNLDTLERDAYYYLLRHEGKLRYYTDIATYVLEEGIYEDNKFKNEDEEYKQRKKLSPKISKACDRFEQYVYELFGQNN